MADTQLVKAVDDLRLNIVRQKNEITEALPKHIDPDRFIAICQMAVVNNPGLVNCDRNSLYNAFSQCAQDGLIPDGREAAISPFAGKAKYLPMVAGICKRARNSDQLSMIDAKVVYVNDHYEHWVDEKGPHFKHVPTREAKGEKLCYYAYAIGKDGGIFFEEMDLDEMAKIKKFALSKMAPDKQKYSPWMGSFESEMERKSVLRRLGKYRLPNSADLDSLFKRDDEFEDDPEDNPPPAVAPAPTTSSRLRGAVIDAEATVIQDPPPPAKKDPTLKEAVSMAKEVFPGAKEPGAKPAAAAAPAKKQEPAKPIKTVKGKIEDIKVQDGESANGKWRRYAVRVSGKMYGTFDKKIGERAILAADQKADVTVGFRDRVENERVYHDIVNFDFEENMEGEPVQPVAEHEVPL